MKNEIWKDIEGFIGYQISNKGRVQSFTKYREGIILKVKIDNHKGRPKAMVTLTDIKNDKKITKSIATLVYKHFIDKNINTSTNIIEYKDKDYMNCSAENLYAISRADFFNQKEHLANMNNIQRYEYDGKEYFLSEIAKLKNINKVTLKGRLKRGLNIKEAAERSTEKRKILKYQGKNYFLSDIVNLKNIKKTTLKARLRYGWTTEESIEIPTERSAKILNVALYEYQDKLMTLNQISKKYNINKDTLYQRIKKSGWSIEDAIEIPVAKYNYKK